MSNIDIIMKSPISSIIMRVNSNESFSSIAFKFTSNDHGPPSGIDLNWNGYSIKGSDTPNNLGIKTGSLIIVSW